MRFFKELAGDQVPQRHALVFYFGIPAVLSYLYAANSAGMARFMPLFPSVTYWVAILMPLWLCLDVATRIVAWVMRPWAPPLWLILMLGAVVAMLVGQPYAAWISMSFQDFMPDGMTYDFPPPITVAVSQLDRLMGYSGTPLIWLLVNYYYDRLLDIPRYRGSLLEVMPPKRLPESSEPNETAQPNRPKISPAGEEFLEKLPKSIGQTIFAVKAEAHYVRVYTPLGSALIRHKFSDVVKSLDYLNGRQVHRSYWVNKDAIEDVSSDGGSVALVLKNGVSIPVSRAYHQVLRSDGVLIED